MTVRRTFQLLIVISLASLAAAGCKRPNHAPNVPSKPTGPVAPKLNLLVTYSTVVTDPDGDDVACEFDWGDGVLLPWSDFAPSGTVFTSQRVWARHGAYQVRARAWDSRDSFSAWSSALEVAVANEAPATPSAPIGPGTGAAPLTCTLAVSTSDPDEDFVSYQLDLGNGDTTDWSSEVPSGTTAYLTATLISGGSFIIRVRARDVLGVASPWSEGHLVTVSGPTVPWRFATPGYERSASPAIGPDGTIYLAEQAGYAYAVNPNGSLRWRVRIPGSIDAPPTVAGDGTVYFSGGSYLHSVRPDGTLNYRLSRGHVDRYNAMSLVGDTVLYYPNPRLYSLNRDGAIRWANRFGGSTGQQVVAINGTIYLQTRSSLVALNPDSSLRWTVPFNGSHYSPPSLGNQGMVYCAGCDGEVAAFDSMGGLVWTCVVDDRGRHIYAAPAIDEDGTLYCGFDRGLCAVTSTGTKAWTFESLYDVRTTPAIAADGTIYFGCDDHYFYALNRDSTLKWRYYLGGDVWSSPVIGPNGTVYVASADGYLYAIEGGSPPAQSPWPMYLHDARHTGWAGTQ